MKARRDVDHYQTKVEGLTKRLMAAEKDLAARQERDERARREADARREPPPERTHYWFEDSLAVASEKLEKLKDRLARNEHKLQVAKVWHDRALTLGTMTFGTAVDENDAETTPLLTELVELDRLLAEVASDALVAFAPVAPTSVKPLAERIADAKVAAGYTKTDVDPQYTLDHDDDDDVRDSATYLCGIPM
mmetsp:Transcript_27243/g.109072  ORF Transcript_27243/g.109072 Transcript_27243/m.109072 type:complete len:192 (-) Transcript_27243:290-865(-)